MKQKCFKFDLPPCLRQISFAALLAAGFGLAATSARAEPPLGLPEVEHPRDNPLTPEKVELGKLLYFDPRLSSDNTISCASCHDPDKGYSNSAQFATGVDKQLGGRNAPTVINTAYQMFQFWDGRAGSLEE